jgi:tRNA(Ile)-lysidine synthase
MYYVCVHALAEKVRLYIHRESLLSPGDRVGIAVSGGADSIALLRLLLELRPELGIVLSVVHFNHQLRGAESDSDAEFVAQLAAELKLQLHGSSADTAQYAGEHDLSLETAARELRYDFFRELLTESPDNPALDKIATAHTLDDQAETVLMRMIRGTGMKGLGGIYPRLVTDDPESDSAGEIVRPLLAITRAELESYLRSLAQAWREDSSNREMKHTRNRVRHLLLPIIEKEFNPAIREGLSELADIARAEEDYWQNESAGWMGRGIHWSAEPAGQRSSLVQLGAPASEPAEPGSPQLIATVDLMWLLSEPLAVQRRAIRGIADHGEFALEFKHVEQILHLAAEENAGSKQLELPQGWSVSREEDVLRFASAQASSSVESEGHGYEYRLPVPGRVAVSEARTIFYASVAAPDAVHADDLLELDLLQKELTVRNWRAGDRFWPVHRKEPKKVKELLQEQQVTGGRRKSWPLVLSGDEIVWVRGFAVANRFRWQAGAGAAVQIREVVEDD